MSGGGGGGKKKKASGSTGDSSPEGTPAPAPASDSDAGGKKKKKSHKRKPGSKRKTRSDQRFTEREVASAVRRNKGLLHRAAKELGISRRALGFYLDKYPSVRRACEDARGRVLDQAENGLFQAVKNQEEWAIRFVLRSLGKDRGYGYSQSTKRDAIPQRQAAPGLVIVAPAGSGLDMDVLLGRKKAPPPQESLLPAPPPSSRPPSSRLEDIIEGDVVLGEGCQGEGEAGGEAGGEAK